MEAVSPSPASQRLYSLSAAFWRYLLDFSSFVYFSAMVSARVLPLLEDFLPEDAVEAAVLLEDEVGILTRVKTLQTKSTSDLL